jgi:hypothetical protein
MSHITQWMQYTASYFRDTNNTGTQHSWYIDSIQVNTHVTDMAEASLVSNDVQEQ